MLTAKLGLGQSPTKSTPEEVKDPPPDLSESETMELRSIREQLSGDGFEAEIGLAFEAMMEEPDKSLHSFSVPPRSEAGSGEESAEELSDVLTTIENECANDYPTFMF